MIMWTDAEWLLAAETFCAFMAGGATFMFIDRCLGWWQEYRDNLPK